MASYTFGLDLGQAQDYSALVVVEHVEVLPPGMSLEQAEALGRGFPTTVAETRHEFEVRVARRWPLGTAYPVVVDDVAEMLRSAAFVGENYSSWSGRQGHASLVRVDATGVGRAVMDLFDERYRRGETLGAEIRRVTIDAKIKQDLGSAVLVALQRDRLHVAKGLQLASVLEQELTLFRRGFTSTGRTTFDTKRVDGHGDLATALMLAIHDAGGGPDPHASRARRVRESR